ncbi:hypothetical protein NITHO_4240008 [Nitrolancea hollandica Lb]|uniref:Uncharacterized protein n=1 Tax=Nitrolancea hollandica Lb TaxID=1129897 RepID=I4EJU3_9BACT|nr:hypothetical protein NITHO_4240008 [Nitrolancea hollandica Lb]
MVKASAPAKLGNRKARSKRLIPSRSTTCHSGTWGWNSAISSSVRVGAPFRHTTQVIWFNVAIIYLPREHPTAAASLAAIAFRVYSSLDRFPCRSYHVYVEPA